MDTANLLEHGRQSYQRSAWTDAYTALSGADQAASLEPCDLELLATSAYMRGRDDEWMKILERAHHAYLKRGDAVRALRCAFWVGMNLALQGEQARGAGWLGRAQRLLEHAEGECVEEGYLLLPLMFQHEAAGDHDAAIAAATRAAAIGERFGDADLFALAVHEEGNILIKLGRVKEGLRLLDEAMVSVTAGELSPIVTGLVYCGVIASCQELYELRRAQEWTAALTEWCDLQPELVAFTGRCLVHRSEIMQLHGAWLDAMEEARRAGSRSLDEGAAAQASYRRGEVHRLRGEFREAEVAFREASRFGWEPQPGLALLRLNEGNTDSAAAAIRRVLGETSERLRRAPLLSASVEILLAAGDSDAARASCEELGEIAASYDSGMLSASAAHARAAIELATADAAGALVSSRRAWRIWHELGTPYEAARARVLVGLACGKLGTTMQ